MKNATLIKITEKRVRAITMDELKNALNGITYLELRLLREAFQADSKDEEYHYNIGALIATVIYRAMEEDVKLEDIHD
jgi:hypothetical protein